MKKITINSSVSFAEIFEDFISSRKAKGLAEKTLKTYHQHFSAISKYLLVNRPVEEITKADLEKMICGMRDAALAPNTIRSYTRT